MATPNTFTPRKRKAVLDGIAGGLPIASACAAAGISRECYYDWFRQGAEPVADKKYKDFYRDALMASAKFEKYHIDKIAKADTWTASAWLLERRFPGTYSKRVFEIANAGEGESPATVIFEK